MPPRVVVDSNVIISAAIAGGKPDRVLDLGRAGLIQVFVSPFIVNEVTDVLMRPKIGFSQRDVTEAIAGMRPFYVVDSGKPRVTASNDDSDNRVIETALVARARYLISGDGDLLNLVSYGRIAIVSSAQFLDIYDQRYK